MTSAAALTYAPPVVALGAPTVDEARRGSAFRPSDRQIEVMRAREPEVLLDGPKDCGKTLSALEVMHARAQKYPRSRHLLARKTRHSLTQSAMVTLRDRVFSEKDRREIRFHVSSQEYRYPNGSVIVVCGLDDPTRLQSSEYDTALIPEATEVSVADWEMVGGLLRNGRMPYAQLMGDCNPSYPKHWLNQRCHTGATRRIRFRHADNPSITPERIARLAAMTGVRRKRLFEGLWCVAEGSVFEDSFDPAVNVIDSFDPPADWRRWWAIDFGFSNPFVWQAWAEDGDGRLYLYREIYHTRRLVEDHARQIKMVTAGEPPPAAIICDHDAEDRATLERHLGMKTRGAWKPAGSVRIGIDAAASRMRPAGDGRPRLFIMRGALVERDDDLFGARGEPLPASTEEEIEAYMWNPKRDEPVREFDHGADCLRYLVAHVDGVDRGGGRTRDRGSASDDEEPRRRPELAGIRSRDW